MAKLSEHAEFYEEMVESMKKVANLDVEIVVEEMNMFFVGYTNVISACRASWRISSYVVEKEEAKANEQNVKQIKKYRHKVGEELSRFVMIS